MDYVTAGATIFAAGVMAAIVRILQKARAEKAALAAEISAAFDLPGDDSHEALAAISRRVGKDKMWAAGLPVMQRRKIAEDREAAAAITHPSLI
jgi:hypothetical protein